MAWTNALTMMAAAAWLLLSGCGEEAAANDTSNEQEGNADAKDSGASSDGAMAAACELPPDCKSVNAPLLFAIEACCSARVACGFRVASGPSALGDTVVSVVDPDGAFEDGCVPRERYFLSFEGLMDERVPVEGGDDILIAHDCQTSAILSIAFPGCCLPSGQCGISTYQMHDTIAVLVGPEAAVAQLECVPAATMNARLSETSLAGFARLHENGDNCDYAALDQSLPPITDPVVD